MKQKNSIFYFLCFFIVFYIYIMPNTGKNTLYYSQINEDVSKNTGVTKIEKDIQNKKYIIRRTVRKTPKNIIKNQLKYTAPSGNFIQDNRFIPYLENIQENIPEYLLNKIFANAKKAQLKHNQTHTIKLGLEHVPRLVVLLLFITIFSFYKMYLVRMFHIK